jgi:2-oxoglutarate/2-oxoacid ferredoxin oxidoreductase subunit alpha
MKDSNINTIEREEVVIKFSGDSGDGMQLTGTLFSDTTALEGEDVSTFPDYPSEIRAPQGTIAGVSGFQIHFGKLVDTPGDFSDVLVAMNPAALKANTQFVKTGGVIIVDYDSFTDKNIKKAGYEENPVSKSAYHDYHIIRAPITSMTRESLKDLGLDNKTILRSKNMFALGIAFWIFHKPLIHTNHFFEKKFKKYPKIVEANKKALLAGYNYAMTIQAIAPTYDVQRAKIEKGIYRNINGNIATAWGFLAASEKSGLSLFCGSYPITPATEILQELSARKEFGVKTFQAEDEIAGICSAIGASFAGKLAVTTTSGPGLALKTEAIGLAVMTELPLVIVDVQRGGPSTGLPTKTEQSDLLQAVFGRNGEAPVVVIAASTPSNCFRYAFLACKIALEHMVPVLLLTDGFIANGAEPWKIPSMKDYPEIQPRLVDREAKDWMPYIRDEDTLARSWAIPGMKGYEHTIGGLEKADVTGFVSNIPENHQKMCVLRRDKVERVIGEVPDLKVEGNESGEVLVIGWGGTYGHLKTVTRELQEEGKDVNLAHFNYIYPLPKNTADILKRYKKIIICELNLGQFAKYLRMNYPEFTYHQYNKVQGQPFTVIELRENIINLLEK